MRSRTSVIACAAAPRGAWLALAAALVALPSRAAEVTEVADAMDEKKPLQIDLDLSYRHVRRDTRLSRENLQADAAGARNLVLVDELSHAQITDELGFRLAVGLFHDLEIHLFAPLVLRDEQSWGYATVNGQSVEATSTLKNNRLDISGCLKPGSCSASAAPTPIVPTPGKSLRGGFRDPTIGVAWGPINEEREARLHPELFPPGKPVSTWVVGFDYTLPLPGDVDDPSKFGAATLAADPAAPGAPRGHELRKAHVFTLWTAFSKRFKVADPYFVIRASAPVAVKSGGIGDGAFDNCWHPDALADVATTNCADAAWKNKTGYQPPYEAGFTIGTELALYEDPKGRQKVALDVHGDLRYVGPGRTYTEITDALGKLTYADEHLGGLASIGVYGRAAGWLQARVAATLGADSPHFITSEPIGRDLNGDGRITLSNGQKNSLEQSPTYDFRLDQIGRRLRAETSVSWGVSGTLALTF